MFHVTQTHGFYTEDGFRYTDGSHIWVSLTWEPAKDKAEAEGETTNKRHHTLCFTTEDELRIAVDNNSGCNKSTETKNYLQLFQ